MLRGRPCGVFLLAILLTLSVATPALGHAELDSATPAEGENLEQAPMEIRLDFNEPIEAAFTPVEVYDSDRNRVDGDDGRTDPDDESVVVASLREDLPAGSYAVEWTVTSADGDPVSGEYSFEVGSSEEPAASTAPEEGPAGDQGTGGEETGGFGSTVLYAGLAVGVIALLGISLRGRVR